MNKRKIAETAEGDIPMGRQEFAIQFQGIYRRLWLVASGIVGDRAEAEDIVQEAAMVAFRKLDDFRAGTNFPAWLTAIVKHCAANHRRKSSGRRTFATDPKSLDQHVEPCPVDGTVDVTRGALEFSSDFDDEMSRVLNLLSSDARCCLLLRVVDGLTYAEISSLLDIPEGTAMSHVHRSKKLIRSRYRDRYPTEKEVVDE
jgi:RNA polymerase sigma-70 factor (ECF subfamily)